MNNENTVKNQIRIQIQEMLVSVQKPLLPNLWTYSPKYYEINISESHLFHLYGWETQPLFHFPLREEHELQEFRTQCLKIILIWEMNYVRNGYTKEVYDIFTALLLMLKSIQRC